jgi:hypothetical protein
MPELPADFDLKLMPDWLKEPASKNPYADYEGGGEDRPSRGRDDWGRGGGRRDDRRGKPGGGQKPGGPRGDGGRRGGQPRGNRPGDRKPDGTRPAGRADDRRGKPGEQHRPGDRGGADRSREDQAPQVPPANVTIEFFPDESCAASIARQVRSTHRAYSLFDLARMFLARPERHRLKITTKTVAEPLYQLGEGGPVWTERAAAERGAFPVAQQKYYEEITEQREAPKGNFTNVARCRANGALLGPTNYHGYQPALRRLYEERFSRRMSFPEFQREIEVVNDPALIEKWKQQASSVTAYRLARPAPAETSEPEAAPAAAEPAPAPEPTAVESVERASEVPVEAASGQSEAAAPEPAAEAAPAAEQPPAAYDGPVFQNIAEVEQHFRENYLPGLVRTASSFHLSGEASRAITDRAIAAAVRQAWEQERGFPGQMMHQLRQHFSRAGLHVFKHRKRMQFVSLIRPAPMEDGSLSESVAEILKVIEGGQGRNRALLAAAILGSDESAVDPARKTMLATDLRWLIETGRVIEFSDGRLELPVVPAKPETPAVKPKPDAAQAEAPAPGAEANAAAAEEIAQPAAELPAPGGDTEPAARTSVEASEGIVSAPEQPEESGPEPAEPAAISPELPGVEP